MRLRLYNTLTRSKQDFEPIDPGHVRLYVCGPTVYDRAHIGNARPLIVFDLLFRLLRRVYGEEAVAYARNITDVDDKINARAADRGVSIRALTEGTIADFHADVAALGCLPPTIEPRATDHIADMRSMIEALVARGIAYVAEEHVLFSVAAMDARGATPRYGSLSRRSLDDMIAGARVEVAPFKRDPVDFVLWKPSKANEPAWPSPCGLQTPGRPGWHIECSAMSFRHLVAAFAGRMRCEPALAQAFDIHGGGIDLVFPHHENEIAQSCCALDAPLMARVWLHNGFLQVEGQKMSKSAGNFVTIHELLRTEAFGARSWPGEVLRLAMLRTHYRQPIDWTVERLFEAEKQLETWRSVLPPDGGSEDPEEAANALADDLNTPAALSLVHDLYKEARSTSGDAQDIARRGRRLRGALELLGLHNSTIAADVERRAAGRSIQDDSVKGLIEAREAARAMKNWAEADRLRDALVAKGIVIKDNKDGTTSWEHRR